MLLYSQKLDFQRAKIFRYARYDLSSNILGCFIFCMTQNVIPEEKKIAKHCFFTKADLIKDTGDVGPAQPE